MGVDSGQKLPICHCAFKGCMAVTSSFDQGSHWGAEKLLYDHLIQDHRHKELQEVWTERCAGEAEEQHEAEMTLLAYYMAGVREKEREHMPLIGPAVLSLYITYYKPFHRPGTRARDIGPSN